MAALRMILIGAGLAATSVIAAGLVTDGPNATFSALVVWAALGIAGLLWEIVALTSQPRHHATPSPRPHVTPQPQPNIVIQYEQPAPQPPQNVAFVPGPPQRPYQPEEHVQASARSIFDMDGNGIYHTPNQPTPQDSSPFGPGLDPNDLFGVNSQARRRPSFDPLAQPLTPMPPLEPDPARSPAPWDNEHVTRPVSPLQEGHLLPRRPATPDEYDAIRAIFSEQGSLNRTVAAVYGSKDANTLAWVKEVLEQ